MANNEIRDNIRPYKNIIPCGGYKMLGGGQIGDSVIPGYVDTLLSEKVPLLSPTLYGVVDEQAEIVEKEGLIVVKNIKMFLSTSLYYHIELGVGAIASEVSLYNAALKALSQKAKVLNCYDIINTWYHMFGVEAFEISSREQYDSFDLRFFIQQMSASLFVSPTLSIGGVQPVYSILCEPDDISAVTTSFIYFTEHGNEFHFKIGK